MVNKFLIGSSSSLIVNASKTVLIDNLKDLFEKRAKKKQIEIHFIFLRVNKQDTTVMNLLLNETIFFPKIRLILCHSN
jgi:hypothetical protein